MFALTLKSSNLLRCRENRWRSHAPLIFSIEPLPDGSLLVTEKERGMSIVSADGVQSALIEGTPQTGHSFDMRGVQYGWGWLLDVSLHPDYADNGWIYLSYSHAIKKAPEENRPGAMTRIVRGKIKDNKWTRQEVIYEAPHSLYLQTRHHYGSRIVFDPHGHLFFGIGDR